MNREIRKWLIITADDYGIRETAVPILHLAREGKLDRVAVLIHFTTPEEAADLLETNVKIDLHLELIDFLKSGSKMQESALLRGLNFTWRYVSGRITAGNAEAQWREQIERFQELFGRLPDGLNTHEHIHYFPKFFRVLLALAEEYGIGYVRFGRSGVFNPAGALVGTVLGVFWHRNKKVYAEAFPRTSDYITSLDWLPEPKRFLENSPEGTIEVVVHPERKKEYRMCLEHF